MRRKLQSMIFTVLFFLLSTSTQAALTNHVPQFYFYQNDSGTPQNALELLLGNSISVLASPALEKFIKSLHMKIKTQVPAEKFLEFSVFLEQEKQRLLEQDSKLKITAPEQQLRLSLDKPQTGYVLHDPDHRYREAEDKWQALGWIEQKETLGFYFENYTLWQVLNPVNMKSKAVLILNKSYLPLGMFQVRPRGSESIEKVETDASQQTLVLKAYIEQLTFYAVTKHPENKAVLMLARSELEKALSTSSIAPSKKTAPLHFKTLKIKEASVNGAPVGLYLFQQTPQFSEAFQRYWNKLALGL